MRARGGLVAILVSGLLASSSVAHADRITDAEDLFRRAKALLVAGKVGDACPMFAESYRLDPGMGTLLNLALCHEQIGKTASAWGEFRSVEQQARVMNPPNESRAQLAREHADKLQPRLSRLRIVVPPAARVPGLVVKVDGEEKSESLWTGVAVDPGTRVVEASAPHKKPSQTKVKIDDEGVVQDVTLKALEDVPVAAAPPPTASNADLDSLDAYAANRAKRITGYVIGGVGLAVLATGGVFGIGAIINDNDAQRCGPPCYRGSNEASASDRATDRALVFANVANVTIPIGAIGVLAGTYLLLTSTPKKVSLLPRATFGGGGLDLTGQW